ncbi:MAG: tetratricopeptide repeat protein [Polyangiales bacterium]
MTTKNWKLLPLLCALGAATACGGGSAEEQEQAVGEGGEAIETADGTGVSVRAHNNWTEGVAMFAANEDGTWNEQTCSATIAKFEAAVEAQQGGQFAEALYMIGLTQERCDNDGEARQMYNRALGVNDKMCKARVAVGLMDLAGGNSSQANTAFQRSVRDDPQCTSGYVNLAIMQRNAGNDAEALSNLRRALAIESDYLPAFNQMALLYYQRGRAANGAASLDLAEIVCRQAQLIDREYATIYNTWGLVKIEKGNVIEALRYFERAIQLDDSMFEAQMNFAQVTLSFRGYEDAQRSFARSVALDDDNYDARVGLGAALRGLERFDEAKAEYERAIQLDANRPEAYFNLGVLHHDYLARAASDPIPVLQQGKTFYEQFVTKARGNERYAETVENTTRRCRDQEPGAQQSNSRAARRRRSRCRPGRIQLVDITIAAMNESAEMQREMERMQAQEAAQQAAQEPAAPTPPAE